MDAAASNETHSICKCDHLTNFAVLMQVKSDSDLEVFKLCYLGDAIILGKENVTALPTYYFDQTSGECYYSKNIHDRLTD